MCWLSCLFKNVYFFLIPEKSVDNQILINFFGIWSNKKQGFFSKFYFSEFWSFVVTFLKM